MKNALILNAHQEYPFAKGELNQEIARRIREHLHSVGYTIKSTTMKDDWDAPEESFDDENEFLLEDKSVDDLYFPQHMNFKFFGMKPIPTFACFDVMKNSNIESDFKSI